MTDAQAIYLEALKSFQSRAYPEAIKLFLLFTENFPDSKGYTIALQRLGESFEGLLDTEYTERLRDGEDEETVRKQFLEKYGHFKCWEVKSGRLVYNKEHFKKILDKFPDSPVADEAAYKMLDLNADCKRNPECFLAEIKSLEGLLEKYPSTSLRQEILYRIARRFHILYEIYTFSPDMSQRNPEKSAMYRRKTVFTYRLVLKAGSSIYSHYAWNALEELEKGKRIYIFR